ncbi:hypothetical protein QJS10_CPA07g01367 [Acorus calamus]|uniref:Cytochrome P450 n=1 Tax=Acorus calamus TaxID=4465 RepID=A0AAV9EGW7_ACOCL|nr:hypothetical protein QJS10_CPA07g01367 [Acorus calamus]
MVGVLRCHRWLSVRKTSLLKPNGGGFKGVHDAGRLSRASSRSRSRAHGISREIGCGRLCIRPLGGNMPTCSQVGRSFEGPSVNAVPSTKRTSTYHREVDSPFLHTEPGRRCSTPNKVGCRSVGRSSGWWSRFLPTKKNRETWRLEKEVRWSVLSMVRERRGSSSSSSSSSDLLQSLLLSADVNYGSPSETDRFLVDNCKNIYFAGHETTAVTATWAMMLLASHPDWQAKARAEVIRVCGDRPSDHHHMLRKMKTLTMVIQETMRLYSPSAFVAREALRDLKLGELRLPKGVNILIPISTMHFDKDIWGPDADAFDPARFARGVSGACRLPHAYMPFGTGTRTCLGQNLAMVELKVVLSTVLSRFNFSLSPSYRHSPAFRLTVETEFGLPLTMTRV